MGLLDGKVAVISGAARGQGRSHALRLAAEGARIIGFDICAHIDTVPFSMGTAEDLAETEAQVHKMGGEMHTLPADVRDAGQVQEAVTLAVRKFGRVDVIVANAGIGHEFAPSWEVSDESFVNTVQVNLIGAWRTAKAGALQMMEQGDGGSIVVTGSGASVKGLPNLVGYVSAKHGLVGMVRTMARELGPHGIRVNAVLPGNTNTPMLNNDAMKALMLPDVEHPTDEQFAERASIGSPMRTPWVEPEDVTEAVLWLASPASRFVTGAALPVDGGSAIP